MSDFSFTVTIQGDSEGYVTFECPYCGSEFKLQAGEYQDEDIPIEDLFCPYCGLTKAKQDFLSEEVLKEVQAIAQNYLVEQLNASFKKMSKTLNRSKGPITVKMKYKPLQKVAIRELKDKDSTETEFKCSCCNRGVKVLYCAGNAKIFCPYCGVDI